MKKFVFFDLDGTLADTDPDIRLSWKAAMADLGLECPRFDELFVAGPPIEEMMRVLFPNDATPEMIDAVRRAFALHYDSDGFPATKEYPGVLDEVRRLKAAGSTVAIVTNKRYAGAMAIARHFGLCDIFDGIYAGDMFLTAQTHERFRAAGLEVQVEKYRKPALLSMVMRLYGARPEDCAMVGDTVSDFEAAAANNVFSVAVAWGYGTAAELSMANSVCRHLPLPL
jgi:phosphoglycolate phosphatase